MSEKVPQQEQALFRSHSTIDMDFQPIEIAGQGGWNIPCHHRNAVKGLQIALNPSSVFVEPNFHWSIIVCRPFEEIILRFVRKVRSRSQLSTRNLPRQSWRKPRVLAFPASP